MAEDLTKWYWNRKDGTKVRMIDMDESHLKKAFEFVCMKEMEYHNKGSRHAELREQLEKIASVRNIEVQYPDEIKPNKPWGNFFKFMRKTKSVVGKTIVVADLQKEEKAILSKGEPVQTGAMSYEA